MGSEDNQKQCKKTIKDGDGIRMREKQGQKNFPYISTPTHLKADQETKQKEMKMHELFSNDSFLHGPYMQLSSCELTRSCFWSFCSLSLPKRQIFVSFIKRNALLVKTHSPHWTDAQEYWYCFYYDACFYFRDKRLPQETSTCLEYVNNVKIDPHLNYYVNTETNLLFSVSALIIHVIFSHVQPEGHVRCFRFFLYDITGWSDSLTMMS